MLPPHSLATTYSNNELFAMLRRGAGESEYLRQCYALTRPEFEGRRAAGLSIVVSPCTGDRTAYVIAVRNVGPNTYQNVRVSYEPLLLNAGNFGLDTTHMPSQVARKVAEIVEFPSIAPGQSVHVVRPGYGPHDQYDGPRETAVDLDFQLDGTKFSANDRAWSEVSVDLPNARSVGELSKSAMARRIAIWLVFACALAVTVSIVATW
jgi:hypothetical protein